MSVCLMSQARPMPKTKPMYNGQVALNNAADKAAKLNDRLVEYGLDIGDVVARFEKLSQQTTFITKNDTMSQNQYHCSGAIA